MLDRKYVDSCCDEGIQKLERVHKILVNTARSLYDGDIHLACFFGGGANYTRRLKEDLERLKLESDDSSRRRDYRFFLENPSKILVETKSIRVA